MIRITRMLHIVLPLVLVLAAIPASSDTPAPAPIIDSTSSGLITFSREERAIRVAAVFAARDPAVVPTLVRFRDSADNVLKEVRGDLRQGNPVVADLTRADVPGRGDLLVRVEVLHKLPGARQAPYPIIVSIQPIGPTGSASLAIFWRGGFCNIPLPAQPGNYQSSQRVQLGTQSQSSQLGLVIEPDQPVLPGKNVDPPVQVMCPGPIESF